MCGELVGDVCVIVLLFGMGLDEFSMSGIFVLYVKKLVCLINYVDVKVLVDIVLV